MSLLGTWSHDSYTDLALEFVADSNAVIADGAGRNNTAALVTTANSTYWLVDRAAGGAPFALLEFFYGISFNLGAFPASGRGTLLQFNSGASTPQIAITVDSLGIIEVYRGSQNGTLLASASIPIQINVAYYLETGGFIDSVGGTAELRLWTNSSDVATIIDFTGNTLAGGSGEISTIGNVDAIPPVDAIPLTCNYDDAYLCDGEGSAFNTFLGNKHIQARFPDDAGFYTEWSPVPGIPNFANVNENPPDSDASYNFAPNSSSAVSASLRSVTSSLNSPTITTPAGSVGDVLFVAMRSSAAASDGAVQPDLVDEGFGSNIEIPPFPPIVTLPHFHFFDPGSGSPSDTVWCGSVAWRVADGTEPASYTFIDTRGDPLEDVKEIVMLRYQDVNLAIPIEDASSKAASAKGTTISFTQVDALTDNDLIVAFEFAETQTPQTPSGYAADYAGTFINVSSKVNPSSSGVIVPSTTLAGADTWGSDAYSLKAMAVIATGGADTFPAEETTSTQVDAVTVKLCARVDSAGNTVGARMRQNSVDLDSDGVEPSTDYQLYQFPYETAPDSSAWSTEKYNSSEAGYALDAEVPPPPPAEAVIFWADADQLAASFGDGDAISPSFVEFGIHGYTMSLARAIAGDYIPQTFETSVGAVNNQDSIQGFTESLSCVPSTRNIGYTNTATGSDLWLPDGFTLIAVFNLSQFDGCHQSGDPVIITRRGNDVGGDFAGWILTAARDGAGDPGASGKIIFYRFDSTFNPICTVNSADNSIAENTTYVVTVICDGVTLKMRVGGVEVDSTAYSTGIEPAGNDLHFLNNGNGVDPPQGQVPYVKIWNIELDNADLTAEENALMAKY